MSGQHWSTACIGFWTKTYVTEKEKIPPTPGFELQVTQWIFYFKPKVLS